LDQPVFLGRDDFTIDLEAVTQQVTADLVRAFPRQVGVRPHRYQTIVRVNRARTLLRPDAALWEVT
jgi:transcriptional regulator GlxA family with amidase domain